MIKGYSKNYNNLTKLIDEIGTKISETTKRFNDLHKASITKGVYHLKQKNLLRLALPLQYVVMVVLPFMYTIRLKQELVLIKSWKL